MNGLLKRIRDVFADLFLADLIAEGAERRVVEMDGDGFWDHDHEHESMEEEG